MTDFQTPSVALGEQLFNDGVTLNSSRRFLEMKYPDELKTDSASADAQRHADSRAYFQWEIDCLTLYSKEYESTSRTCPSCGGVSRAQAGDSQYAGPWKCVACGRRDVSSVQGA